MDADFVKYQRLREEMTSSQIQARGIKDPKVLDAMRKVPRHLFVSEALMDQAYGDFPLPIGEQQTISQPYTVAFQTQLLDVKPREKVLEIGTGSGYQACVLSKLGAKVFTIERQKKLYQQTKEFLIAAGFPEIKCFYGDGYKGLPAYAPFDKIIITAGAPEIPEALIEQLKPGGRLVVPVGDYSFQIMTLVIKNADGSITKEEHGVFAFVPMLKNKANDNV